MAVRACILDGSRPPSDDTISTLPLTALLGTFISGLRLPYIHARFKFHSSQGAQTFLIPFFSYYARLLLLRLFARRLIKLVPLTGVANNSLPYNAIFPIFTPLSSPPRTFFSPPRQPNDSFRKIVNPYLCLFPVQSSIIFEESVISPVAKSINIVYIDTRVREGRRRGYENRWEGLGSENLRERVKGRACNSPLSRRASVEEGEGVNALRGWFLNRDRRGTAMGKGTRGPVLRS